VREGKSSPTDFVTRELPTLIVPRQHGIEQRAVTIKNKTTGLLQPCLEPTRFETVEDPLLVSVVVTVTVFTAPTRCPSGEKVRCPRIPSPDHYLRCPLFLLRV